MHFVDLPEVGENGEDVVGDVGLAVARGHLEHLARLLQFLAGRHEARNDELHRGLLVRVGEVLGGREELLDRVEGLVELEARLRDFLEGEFVAVAVHLLQATQGFLDRRPRVQLALAPVLLRQASAGGQALVEGHLPLVVERLVRPPKLGKPVVRCEPRAARLVERPGACFARPLALLRQFPERFLDRGGLGHLVRFRPQSSCERAFDVRVLCAKEHVQ